MVTYQRVGSKASRGPQPGTRALQDHILETFAATNLGIYANRDVCGNWAPKPFRCSMSVHAEGRAADSGYQIVRPNGHPDGHRLAGWLVSNSEQLGIQHVIWAGRQWRCDKPRWHRYSGRSDHFDHVHWEQTWEAARRSAAGTRLIIANLGDDPLMSAADDIMAKLDTLQGEVLRRLDADHLAIARDTNHWVKQLAAKVDPEQLAIQIARHLPGGPADAKAVEAALRKVFADAADDG